MDTGNRDTDSRDRDRDWDWGVDEDWGWDWDWDDGDALEDPKGLRGRKAEDFRAQVGYMGDGIPVFLKCQQVSLKDRPAAPLRALLWSKASSLYSKEWPWWYPEW